MSLELEQQPPKPFRYSRKLFLVSLSAASISTTVTMLESPKFYRPPVYQGFVEPRLPSTIISGVSGGILSDILTRSIIRFSKKNRVTETAISGALSFLGARFSSKFGDLVGGTVNGISLANHEH